MPGKNGRGPSGRGPRNGKKCPLESHIKKGQTKHAALNEMEGAGKKRRKRAGAK